MTPPSRAQPNTLAWLVQFALGAAAALSAVFVSNHLQKAGTTKAQKQTGGTDKPSTNRTLDTNGALQQRQQQKPDDDAIMDTPNLENRILRKAETVIQWRTTRLILIIERCTNDHNYSAILRTAEALGIQIVWTIEPPVPEDTGTAQLDTRNKNAQRSEEELKTRAMHHLFAQKATDWLTIRDFATTEECVAAAKELGYQLWVTDLSQEAECLTMTSPAVPDKVALVMGTEAVGCSQTMLNSADKRVYLPQRGFADSLNISVATALVIHQLFSMEPSLIGGISESEKHELRKNWYTKLASQRILTSSQKKQRHKLKMNLRTCKSFRERLARDPDLKVMPKEAAKLEKEAEYRAELESIEALVSFDRVQEAIQEWIERPPPALTDMRRADIHRVTFVGKKTKKQHASDWKNMVATSTQNTQAGATAKAFREKMGLSVDLDSCQGKS